MHERNCFVTLTLREHQESLDHSQWQRFAKRARRKLGPFRFFMAGEYGEENLRPHYHACLFGVDFADKVYERRSPSGEKLYSSATLEALWGLGFTSVGEVTFQSAAYVARYVMKKITGPGAEAHYGDRAPEYCRSSNGGRSGERGIGFRWFERYGRTDVLPTASVLVNGVRCSPPRYYRKLLKEQFPLSVRAPAMLHELAAREAVKDSGPGRIQAKEAVKLAQLGRLKRKL